MLVTMFSSGAPGKTMVSIVSECFLGCSKAARKCSVDSFDAGTGALDTEQNAPHVRNSTDFSANANNFLRIDGIFR